MQPQTQLTMFDAKPHNHITTARRLRDKGVKQASDGNAAWLKTMRSIAHDICRIQGHVTADHLRAWCDANRYWPTHPNAYGAILTKREFVPGEFIQSTQAQRRGGHVRVWRLRENHV